MLNQTQTMSGSSEVNLKQTLRKLEYPLCAQEALKKISKFYPFTSKKNNLLLKKKTR